MHWRGVSFASCLWGYFWLMPKGSRVPGQTSVLFLPSLFASARSTLWLSCQTLKCATYSQNVGLVLKINKGSPSPKELIYSVKHLFFLIYRKENVSIIIFQSRRDFSILCYSELKRAGKQERTVCKEKVQWVDISCLLLYMLLSHLEINSINS